MRNDMKYYRSVTVCEKKKKAPQKSSFEKPVSFYKHDDKQTITLIKSESKWLR